MEAFPCGSVVLDGQTVVDIRLVAVLEYCFVEFPAEAIVLDGEVIGYV